MSFFDWITEIGWVGFLDIFFMALLIYFVILWFTKTKAAFVLAGIFIVAGIYLLARQFNLIMTASVFEKFFAVILIAMIVIFQEELKHVFEQVAIWSLNRSFYKKKVEIRLHEQVPILVRTLFDFAQEKIGALVVVRGKDMILRHLDGGVDLNGEISEPLLKSIFDPHSAGHDGAVIIEGNRILQFASHLPLSKNLQKIRNRGTRHAAALGLSELSDALCLVVSEEKGTICAARFGIIHEVKDRENLTFFLEKFYQETNPQRETTAWNDFWKKNSLEKLYAFALAVGLWFIVVHGSQLTHRSYLVPVTFEKLPAPWHVSFVKPKEVEVTIRASRTSLYFVQPERMKIFLNLKLEKGMQSITVYSHNLTIPKNLVLENIDPKEVIVRLEQAQAKESNEKKKTANQNGEKAQ